MLIAYVTQTNINNQLVGYICRIIVYKRKDTNVKISQDFGLSQKSFHPCLCLWERMTCAQSNHNNTEREQ